MSPRIGVRLYEVTVALEEIERELVAGGMAREGLEHFKMAVDHVRLSVWALLNAGQVDEASDPSETERVIARYRLNRVEGICRKVLMDIENGVITPDSPELERFRTTVQDTIEQVDRFIGGQGERSTRDE